MGLVGDEPFECAFETIRGRKTELGFGEVAWPRPPISLMCGGAGIHQTAAIRPLIEEYPLSLPYQPPSMRRTPRTKRLAASETRFLAWYRLVFLFSATLQCSYRFGAFVSPCGVLIDLHQLSWAAFNTSWDRQVISNPKRLISSTQCFVLFGYILANDGHS